MKHICIVFFACVIGLATAAPVVLDESIAWTQGNPKRTEITYVLSEGPAIVTVDVQTNAGAEWVSIGLEHVRSLSGDVNRVVPAGDETRRIVWDARADWPDHLVRGDDFRVVVKAWSLKCPPDYLVVDLRNGSRAYYESQQAIPGSIQDVIYKTDKLVMRKIHAAGATRWLGSPFLTDDDYKAGFGRETEHRVTLSEDYYLGIYEFTQGQYSNVYVNAQCDAVFGGAVPSSYSQSDRLIHPVEMVRYITLRDGDVAKMWPERGHEVGDASFFHCFRKFVDNALQFDLPTDAQWEFACKAGDPTTAKFTSGGDDCGDWAVTGVSAGAAVGSKLPNKWGLYDMNGNIGEWCLDRFDQGGYPANCNLVDPAGMASGSSQDNRSYRGGCYEYKSDWCRSSIRYRFGQHSAHPTIGFRVCCPAVVVK